MEQLHPTQVAARELLIAAERRGIDLRPLWEDWIFCAEDRMISLWHEEWKYHYALDGETGQPTGNSSFDAFWSESGVIGGIDEALQLLLAWLVDRKAVGALPARDRRSWGTS
jgi:hypothetical protein